MDGIDELRQFSRENLHRIWKTTKEGRTLSGEEHRLAEAMRAHPEYHNAWEFADLTGPTRYEVEGTNPYLHIRECTRCWPGARRSSSKRTESVSGAWAGRPPGLP
jgi:hypothetical protein